MRRTLAAVAVVALFAALPAVAAPTVGACEPTDAGGSAATASSIGTPAACQGSLGVADADFYKFDVTAGQTIALQVVTGASDADVPVTLIPPTGSSMPCTSGRCQVDGAAAGTWKFSVIRVSGTAGSYAVALAAQSTNPNPGNSCEATDAPNTSPGTSVQPPVSCTGALTADDKDWYAFNVPAGNSVLATVASVAPNSARLALRDPLGAAVACSAVCSVALAAPGTWSLQVSGPDATTTSTYALAIALAPTTDPSYSCEGSTDASDVEGDAKPVPSTGACTGKLASTSDVDIYSFEAPKGTQNVFGVVVAPVNGAAYSARVYTNDSEVTCTVNQVTLCSSTDPDPGLWYVRIARTTDGPAGAYALAIAMASAPPTPTIACESPDDAPNAAPGQTTTTPAVCSGRIESQTDQDWFEFQVGNGDTIAAALTRDPTVAGGSASIKLRSPSGVDVTCANDVASACTVPSAAPGTWNLAVFGRTAATASSAYVFALVVAPLADPLSNTCESPDAGSTTGTATGREAASACIGKIADAADVDVFSFAMNLPPGAMGVFDVSVSALNGSTYDVTVFDAAGVQVACAAAVATTCPNTEAHAGTWYVRVARGGGAPGSYSMVIAAQALDPGPAQSAVEQVLNTTKCELTDAGATAATAGDLPWRTASQTGALCRGSVADADLVDVYRFRVFTDTATVRVLLQPEPGLAGQSVALPDLTLKLTPPPSACAPEERDVNGDCPAAVSQIGRNGQPDFVERGVTSVAKSGDWVITIGRAPGSPGGSYELGVHVQNG